MTKLVVFDDTQAYLDVAKSVIEQADIPSCSGGLYFNDHSQVLEHLHTRSDEVYGVISDLFAPAEKDYMEQLRFYVGAAGQAPDASEFDINHVADLLGRMATVHENPSGLEVVARSIELGLPTVLMSQGNRHKGNLAIVRSVANYHPALEFMYDPIEQLLPGVETDKYNSEHWQKALAHIEDFRRHPIKK